VLCSSGIGFLAMCQALLVTAEVNCEYNITWRGEKRNDNEKKGEKKVIEERRKRKRRNNFFCFIWKEKGNRKEGRG